MKTIKVKGNEYEMKRLTINEYMDYLDASEVVNGAGETGYTRKHIELMMEWIVKAYGNQFSVDDLKAPETELDGADIIFEFLNIDLSVADKINKRVAKLQKNFMKRK